MSGTESDTDRTREVRYVAWIIALYLCVSIPFAVYLNIWIDEAYSLRTVSDDLAFAIEDSGRFQQHPPFYFMQLWGWHALNSSIPFLRMNSVVLAALSLWVTYLAARRWLPGKYRVWAVGAVAMNAYSIYAATELRSYCMVLLLSALLLLLFHDGFYAERTRHEARAAYAGAALVSLFTHYYLGFFLVAAAVPFLAERRWREFFSYCAWMIGVGALFVPGFLLIGGHVHAVAHAAGEGPTPLRSLVFVVGRIFALPFALPLMPGGVRWAAGLIVMLFMSALAWFFRAGVTPQVRALWIIVSVIGGFYFLVVEFLIGESVLPRHFLVVLIPACFAMLSLISVSGRYQVRALAVWLIAMVGFNFAACVVQFGSMAKLGDFRRVARHLEQNEKPGESIVILASHAELPLSFYYRGTNRLVPLPERDDFSDYVLEKSRLESPEQVREELAGKASDEGLLWVFTDRPPDSVFMGLDLNYEFLEDVLTRDYVLMNERDFYHGKLRLFQTRGAVLAKGSGLPGR